MPEEISPTIETPQPMQPTEPKSTNWPKIILAALIGLGLLAGSAYAGYWYGTKQAQQIETPTSVSQPTPTPSVGDETKDWKIYTNSRFGYEIKYPPSLTIDSSADNCTHIFRGDRTSHTIRISIGVREVPPQGEFCFPTGLGVVEKEEELDQFVFRVDGKDYQLRDVRLVVPPNDDVWGALTLGKLEWLIIKNKSGREDFSIFYTLPYSKYDDGISVIRKILSTFKLLALEPTPPAQDQTKDWKTYTDATHNFSLKYPSSWQVVKGNQGIPSVPSTMTEMINLQSDAGVFGVSVIPWHNNLKKDLREELSSFMSRYLGDFDISYENYQIDGEAALRGSYIQSVMGSQTKVVVTAVEKGTAVFFFKTQFDIKDTSHLDSYNQILSTFKFLD